MNIKEKLEKFERYLKRQNFNGTYFHLKRNILNKFREDFSEELKT